MDTVVDNYISIALPGHKGIALKQANQLLLDRGSEDHLSIIENYISLSGNELEDHEVQDLIINRILIEVENFISDFGVGLGELNLNLTPLILDTLINLENFDDKQSILDICEGDGTPEDKFADILHLVHGDVEQHDFFEHILYVTPSLIDRIENVVIEEMSTEVEEDPVINKDKNKIISDRLNKFLAKHDASNFKTLREEGYGLRFKIDTYLKQCIDPESRSEDKLAIEFIACAIASGRTGSDILNDADTLLENYIDDYTVVMNTLQRVRSIVSTMDES